MGLATGIANYKAASQQAKAAGEESRRAERSGREGEAFIAQAAPRAQQAIEQGFGQGREELQRGDALLQQQQQANEVAFEPERAVGQSALARLNDAVINGNQDAVQVDPGYQFRLAEGNKAIERAAAAGGSFGGGGNLKDFGRFSQGLASQEYGQAVNRLLQLQSSGSNANRANASLNTGLTGQRANAASALSSNAVNEGGSLANLYQSTAALRANARNNTAGNVSGFNLQQANALAQGTAGIGRSVDNTVKTAATFYVGGAGGLAAGKAKPEI